jgi:hypothetical protein
MGADAYSVMDDQAAFLDVGRVAGGRDDPEGQQTGSPG